MLLMNPLSWSCFLANETLRWRAKKKSRMLAVSQKKLTPFNIKTRSVTRSFSRRWEIFGHVYTCQRIFMGKNILWLQHLFDFAMDFANYLECISNEGYYNKFLRHFLQFVFACVNRSFQIRSSIILRQRVEEILMVTDFAKKNFLKLFFGQNGGVRE